MAEPPVPNVLAMLLCDQVIVEEKTKKKSLIGIFDNLYGINFPAPRDCAIYVKLADAEGHYDLNIRIVNLKDEGLLGEFNLGADIATRTGPAEFVIQYGGLPFPEPGKFEFQLFANGMYLARITMNVMQMKLGDAPWQPQR